MAEFTIGVEEEFHVLDGETAGLTKAASRVLSRLGAALISYLRPALEEDGDLAFVDRSVHTVL